MLSLFTDFDRTFDVLDELRRQMDRVWDDYDGAWHEAALRCAHGVVTAVAAGRFWPPREEVRNDDFAALIHDGAAASFDVSGWPAPEGEGAT